MKERCVVVFLDDNLNQQRMFNGLYNSFKLSKSNETNDLIVFTPLDKDQIPNDCIHIKTESISKEGLFFNYGYINSIHCLTTKEAEILYNYKYILRTDVDVFLTSKYKDFIPQYYTTGHGGYNNDENIKNNLKTIANTFNLKYKENYNIGSTHYGYAPLVVNIAKLQFKISEHIFTNWFKEDEGAWAGWYKGVTTMYAGELAVNHLCDESIKTNKIDFYSDSNNKVSDYYHIHSWHTENDYSKHKLLSNKYADIIKTEIKDIDIIKNYCLYCAL